VICYNLLIDAFGQKFLYKEAESTYLQLHEARCIPNEDTYALLIKAYCLSGKLQNAEAVFAEMRNYGLPSSMLQHSHTLHINHLRYIYKYDIKNWWLIQ
jgi:pentatricopeptide repeat protein